MGLADRGVQQVKAKRAVKFMRRHVLDVALGTVAMVVGVGCPVALHAHRCACGCSLVSSMPDTLAAS